ncbi:MAG: hypothetical protein IKI67_07710 [Bacteroidales bacterium]|nr:hypothetical protein [Bacteroidales bacterium]
MKKSVIILIATLICSTLLAQHKDFSTMSFEEQGIFMEGVWEYISPDGKIIFTTEFITTTMLDNTGKVKAYLIIGCYKLINNNKVIEDNLYKLDKYRGKNILGEFDLDYMIDIMIFNSEYIKKKKLLNHFNLHDNTTGLDAGGAFFELEFSYIKLISSKKGQETIFMHLEEGEGEYEELPNNPDRIFSMPTDMTLKKKH